MNYYFITGSSKGIGKALAEDLLKNPDARVTGIARTHTLHHANYTHVTADLADTGAASAIRFPALEKPGTIVLVNNAGTIGAIKRMGHLDEDDITRVFNVNLVSPAILMNNFIKAYTDIKADKIILNISSGAGKNPIDGWSSYCSAKAGMDMLSRVADAEETIKPSGFRIFSVAPGVVDTGMQAEIRRADMNEFSRLKDFITYKESAVLSDPGLISRKLMTILAKHDLFKEVVFSVRDFD